MRREESLEIKIINVLMGGQEQFQFNIGKYEKRKYFLSNKNIRKIFSDNGLDKLVEKSGEISLSAVIFEINKKTKIIISDWFMSFKNSDRFLKMFKKN